jgi:anthranilate synthase component 1
MLYPTRDDYLKLADDFDVVPVVKEILADTETPVSVLQRFCERENVFLLESMEGGETWGRYSIIGIDPELMLDVDHLTTAPGQLEQLRGIYQGKRVAEVPGLPRFFGGAVGIVAYEAMGEFERMPTPKAGMGDVVPSSRFMKADQLVVFDNLRHTAKIVVCTFPGEYTAGDAAACYADALARIESIVADLSRPVPPLAGAVAGASEPVAFESNMTPAYFKEMVAKAKGYIFAGDIIQTVLSQRFTTACNVPPITLYRALRFLNPSPYTFFVKVGDQVLVGSSPEVMVRLTDDRVAVRPIAGTRPRGATPAEDCALAKELLADEKERAEHVMLVDLGRNDIGRIAETGSVEVSEFMVIERYSHVMHIVSHVEGTLRKGLDAYDVMRATFPAGTLSGAPKIRAMEVINELEPGPRGAYGGAVGYISYLGNMDLAITIRTLEVSEGKVSVLAGAGIVYDSDPEKEYQETCHKSRGMQKAVEMAMRGLEVIA